MHTHDDISIIPGRPTDYAPLARFHYRAQRPATCVHTLSAIDRTNGELVGVLTISMPTLNGPWRRLAWPRLFRDHRSTPRTKGSDAAGFIKEESYSWLIGYATSGVTNFDSRRLLIDSSAFTNPIAGAFSLDLAGGNLYLNYTPTIAPPQWNVDANGSWSVGDNWLPRGAPNGTTALANFLGKITDPHTVTLDGNKTVSTIFFD